jgi:hypothetical protein
MRSPEAVVVGDRQGRRLAPGEVERDGQVEQDLAVDVGRADRLERVEGVHARGGVEMRGVPIRTPLAGSPRPTQTGVEDRVVEYVPGQTFVNGGLTEIPTRSNGHRRRRRRLQRHRRRRIGQNDEVKISPSCHRRPGGSPKNLVPHGTMDLQPTRVSSAYVSDGRFEVL